MNRVVVDASAVLAVLLNEPHRAAIIRATVEAELLSPDSLPFEVANALSARVKRRDADRLDPVQAESGFERFLEMEIRLLPQAARDHARALSLAGRQGIYAYDAYMLLAAQSEKAHLLTLDGLGRKMGLLQQARMLGIPVVNLED